MCIRDRGRGVHDGRCAAPAARGERCGADRGNDPASGRVCGTVQERYGINMFGYQAEFVDCGDARIACYDIPKRMRTEEGFQGLDEPSTSFNPPCSSRP